MKAPSVSKSSLTEPYAVPSGVFANWFCLEKVSKRLNNTPKFPHFLLDITKKYPYTTKKMFLHNYTWHDAVRVIEERNAVLQRGAIQ